MSPSLSPLNMWLYYVQQYNKLYKSFSYMKVQEEYRNAIIEMLYTKYPKTRKVKYPLFWLDKQSDKLKSEINQIIATEIRPAFQARIDEYDKKISKLTTKVKHYATKVDMKEILLYTNKRYKPKMVMPIFSRSTYRYNTQTNPMGYVKADIRIFYAALLKWGWGLGIKTQDIVKKFKVVYGKEFDDEHAPFVFYVVTRLNGIFADLPARSFLFPYWADSIITNLDVALINKAFGMNNIVMGYPNFTVDTTNESLQPEIERTNKIINVLRKLPMTKAKDVYSLQEITDSDIPF